METRTEIKKIIFTGPECSGKSTLSTAIAKKLNLPLVREYAREYLQNLDNNYNYTDLIKIAKGQLKREIDAISNLKKQEAIICDTSLKVIKIWSQFKFLKCDPFIIKNEDHNAHYILCKPDFEWKYDPLRENQHDRMELFRIYYQDLIKKNIKFIIASGSHLERMLLVTSEIKRII